MRDSDRDGIHHAEQVDVAGVDERHRVECSSHGHRQDARVGDDDVDLAEIGQSCLDSLAEFVALPHVGDLGHHAAADLLDRAFGLRQVVRSRQRIWIGWDVAADIDRDDVGTFLGHLDRMRATLSTGRTGDESDLALEFPSHSSSTDYERRLNPALER